ASLRALVKRCSKRSWLSSSSDVAALAACSPSVEPKSAAQNLLGRGGTGCAIGHHEAKDCEQANRGPSLLRTGTPTSEKSVEAPRAGPPARPGRLPMADR